MTASSPTPFNVPKAMSTQHPDNAFLPPFATDDEVLKGEDEIAEADFVFSTLGCDEQMWDYEGKGADIDVVMKLLVARPEFFQEHRLGKDVFLTLRIPNPSVEHGMRKRAEEALHNITTSFDLAQQFYQNPDVPPIFEVILPFTTSADEAYWVYQYYQTFVGRSSGRLAFSDMPLGDWLGVSLPERINVIPLVEDWDTLVHIDGLVREYLARIDAMNQWPPYLRVFLARSDPALNYGLLSATLLNKVALQRLERLEETSGVPILPIIGVGGVPFRGNFRPGYVDSVLEEYPSVQTFSVQSSFKFDNSPEIVRQEVQKVRQRERGRAFPIDEERALDLAARYTAAYQRQVERLAPLINVVAPLVPRRRDRRLHIGLYGYSRTMREPHADSETRLPRAITFCAALYSLGVPPELLALESLSDADARFLASAYPHFRDDIAAAGRYANEGVFRRLLGDEAWRAASGYVPEVDREHRGITTLTSDRVDAGARDERTRRLALWAAETRRFLG